MSTFPPSHGDPAPRTSRAAGRRAARPALLTVVVAGGLAAAVLTLATAVVGFVGGRAAVEDELRSGLNADLRDLVGGLTAVAVDDAYGTIKARAAVLAVVAVVVALLSVAAVRASVGVRVGLLLFLLAGLGVLGRTVTDVYPSAGVLLGWAAVLASLAVVATLFLPPVNRYRSALRTTRTAPGRPGGGYRPVR